MAAGIAALIAHITFWVLLAYGWVWGELRVRGIALFLALWIAGYAALTLVPFGTDAFFSWVAVLDVALVFLVFRGDVRIT